MDMKNMTVEDFASKTASSEPAPGGGSVAALAGALAGALSEMVARLTIGKRDMRTYRMKCLLWQKRHRE